MVECEWEVKIRKNPEGEMILLTITVSISTDSLLPNGYRGPFPLGQSAWGVKVTTHSI
jgi:hypothetical protein